MTQCNFQKVWKILLWNLANHIKKNETKNIRPLIFSFLPIAFWCFWFCFLCGLQDFKILIHNWTAKHLVQGTYLFWVDFTSVTILCEIYGFFGLFNYFPRLWAKCQKIFDDWSKKLWRGDLNCVKFNNSFLSPLQ